MDYELYHYGVKGMKWGVRRTPEQLGHRIGQKNSESSLKKKAPKQVKNQKAAKSSVLSLSDEELKSRIERLNMEEKYLDLLDRRKERNPTIRRKLAKAGEEVGKQLLSKAVSMAVDYFTSDKRTIGKLNEADVADMTPETLEKVAKMYENAFKINSTRSKLAQKPSSGSSDSTGGSAKKAESDKTSTSSKSTNTTSASKNTSTTGNSKQQLDDWIRERNRAMRDLNRRR